jgi:hypothetical protein
MLAMLKESAPGLLALVLHIGCDQGLLHCLRALLKDTNTNLIVVSLVHPEGILVLHDVSQNGSTKEDHVLASGRILNANLEFLGKRVSM